MNRPSELQTISILNTPLAVTNYADALAFCIRLAQTPRSFAVEFANTHVVTLRRHDPQYFELTSRFDYFIPDGMPLVWLLNHRGAKLQDRVYGPTFMKYALQHSSGSVSHYFLGGFDDCGKRLLSRAKELNPEINIAGSKYGHFSAADEPAILDEINRLSPDFIWVGLGTPKQQAWVHRWKPRINRGVIFTVGFAFDVIAGTKTDAPQALQRLGLTWLFRLLSEPRRLAGRYFKYNSLFLYYLLRQLARPRLNRQKPGQQ